MVNIPNQEILSLVMMQRHPTQNNGVTNIRYCIASKENQLFAHKEEMNKILYLLEKYNNKAFHYHTIPEMNMYNYIYNIEFNLIEGESTTRASSYNNALELGYGQRLAEEDDFRFQLHYKLLNAPSSLELQKGLDFLNLTKTEFYQLFVTEGKGLGEIYESRRPDLPSLEQLGQRLITQVLQEEIEDHLDYLHYSSELVEWIDIILTTNIAKNSNIDFERTEDCNSTALIITLTQSVEGGGMVLYEEKNKIIQIEVKLNQALLKGEDWPLLLHDISHSVIDHPCENGFYACKKEKIVADFNPPSVLVHQYVDDTSFHQNAQTFLPWDIAALRYSYGMPEARNITYELSSSSGLKKALGYPIKNNAVVTLSNVGDTVINICDVKSYALDLRYDHRSSVNNHDIDFEFFLSYDTEISQIKINNDGSIILSENFKTSIILQHGCYDVILHGDNYQSDLIKHFDNFDTEICNHIDVYNYNSSLHEITL
jgi:hypothetical protein